MHPPRRPPRASWPAHVRMRAHERARAPKRGCDWFDNGATGVASLDRAMATQAGSAGGGTMRMYPTAYSACFSMSVHGSAGCALPHAPHKKSSCLWLGRWSLSLQPLPLPLSPSRPSRTCIRVWPPATRHGPNAASRPRRGGPPAVVSESHPSGESGDTGRRRPGARCPARTPPVRRRGRSAWPAGPSITNP